MQADRHWHLDKRVQISHIVTTLVAAVGLAVYIGTIKSDVEVLKAQAISVLATQHDRDERQDRTYTESLAQIRELVIRVDSKLDRLHERQKP